MPKLDLGVHQPIHLHTYAAWCQGSKAGDVKILFFDQLLIESVDVKSADVKDQLYLLGKKKSIYK